MRLLSPPSRELVEFFGNNIPKYAILSHNGEDEEITFQDIQFPRSGKRNQEMVGKTGGVPGASDERWLALLRFAAQVQKWHLEKSTTLILLVSQGVISRNYDDSQYDGLILD
jgi:hypothetical protein